MSEVIVKKIATDEIQVSVSFENGYPINIAIEVNDADVYPPLPMDESAMLARFRDAIAGAVMQLLAKGVGIDPRAAARQKKKQIFTSRVCPNCQTPGMQLVTPCCSEKEKLAEKGIKATLTCKKCGSKLWVKDDEYDVIMAEQVQKDA